MRLKDKVALITGAPSGIGAATARTFAREGAAVVVADLNDEGGQRMIDQNRDGDGTAEFVHADIAQPKEVEAPIGMTGYMVQSTVLEFSLCSACRASAQSESRP